jgi:hypothetical protein
MMAPKAFIKLILLLLSPSSPFITVHPRRKKTLGASARLV